MPGQDLTSRDLDDLLQLIFDRLRGRRQGLALAEPAVILLDAAREQGHGAYRVHLPQYEPIILDVFISGAAATFGYDAKRALIRLCEDIPSLSSEYRPAAVAEGLERLRADLRDVDTALAGGEPAAPSPSPAAGALRERVAGSVALPIVSAFAAPGGVFTTSRLIAPRIELRVTGEWSMRRRIDPAVTFSHIFSEPDDPFENQLREAVGLAERIAVRSSGAGPLPRLPRQYLVSLPEIAAISTPDAARMKGGSAGLAFAALITELIGGLELGPGVRIAEGTAFTGGIDDRGAVLPVEDSMIPQKVRAAFYSTIPRLVVPGRNLAAARDALSSLGARHPRRRLELIPAETFEALLDDGRVARRRRPPPGRAALQRLFHWRKHLLAGASAAAAALVSIFILPAYIDREVFSITAGDSTLVLKNRADHVVTEHHLGYRINPKQTKSTFGLLIRDIDSRPGDEVLALVVETRERGYGGNDLLHLYLFSSRGELVRETAYTDREIVRGLFPGSQYGWQHRLMGFEVFDGDGDGYDELYSLVHHGNRPPFLLVRFSLRDTATATFLHNGLLRTIKPIDVEGDGRPELLASGYNPALDRAIVAIFDPAVLDGASPRGARLEIPGHGRDVARYYIRLPDSDLLRRFGTQLIGKLIGEIVESDYFFSVIVKARQHQIRFDFDRSLVAVGAAVYEIRQGVRHKDAMKNDWVPNDQSRYAEDIAGMLAGIRYWDGEEWQPHPVENASYRRIKAEAAGGEGGSRR